jgi:hypothetical protein
MLSSPFLETIISLILIILIFSILVTCVQEGYVSITKARGKMLQFAIGEILNDQFNKNFAYLLYQHPQVDLLKRKQGELPSYIGSEIFARSLIDLIAKESTEVIYENIDGVIVKKVKLIQPIIQKTGVFAGIEMNLTQSQINNPDLINLAQRFKLGAESLQYSDLRKLLLSFYSNSLNDTGQESVQSLRLQIENWYNSYMDRVTGWYKRKVRMNLFLAAALVTMTFNLNFITLSKNIYADTKLRNSLTHTAESMSREENPIARIQNQLTRDSLVLKDIDVDALAGTELPIGWKITIKDVGAEGKSWLGVASSYVTYFFKNHFKPVNIFGWLIFILTLSLGAPFWFDVLKKLVNMRNSGIAPQQKANA